MTLHTKNILRPALATAALLLIPLVAMQFTNEVTWTLSDFVIAGLLLFSTGLAAEMVFRKGSNTAYRLASGLALATTLFLVWANLAVGLVGSGANLPNLMFGVVPAVGLIGAIIARLQPQGMARTMFAMTLAVGLVPLVALAIRRPEIDLGVAQVFGVTAFFAGLFVTSALLFRRAATAIAHSMPTAS